MMDAPNDVPDDPAGLDLPPGNHAIGFERVSFRYGDNWVLEDVNLAIGAVEEAEYAALYAVLARADVDEMATGSRS